MKRPRTPWHLRVIGVASVSWNALGAMDYVMTQIRIEAYMSQYTEKQLSYFQGFPAWVQAAWAIAVFASVLGSILLLFHSRHAVPAFRFSLIAMLANALYTYILAETSLAEITGPFAIAFTTAIFVVAVLLLVYAIRQRATGVLR